MVSKDRDEPRAEEAASATEGALRHGRREVLARLARLGLVSAGTWWVARALYDAPGFTGYMPSGPRQVRDFRPKARPEEAVMAVAASSTNPEELTRRAIQALGGMGRFVSRGDFVVSIADLATFMRPTLTVLDATRVLFRNGPQGGNLSDAKDVHQVIASRDEVAADTYGAALLGVDPNIVTYLRLGQERKLGVMHPSAVVTV